jgi:2'-5' RNA ligase
LSRLFIALDLSDSDKKALSDWRLNKLNLPFKSIPWQNFHITLAFLGNVDEEQQAKLQVLIQAPINKFSRNGALALCFDHCGYFKKPKVYYIANSIIPTRLLTLANELKELALSLGIYQDERPYLPHISLFRKAIPQQKKPTLLSTRVEINSLSLYRSYSTEHGVFYNPMETWPLSKIYNKNRVD